MRRFVMLRHSDVTGVSGRGVVIWGVVWPDGRVAYRWNTQTATSVCADCIEDVVVVHGHGGATELVWIDDEDGGGVGGAVGEPASGGAAQERGRRRSWRDGFRRLVASW